jgi:hypothetical protein
MLLKIKTERITAPWTEYRKVIGGLFGGAFLVGSLFVGILGGAGLFVLPLALAGSYAAWSAIDAALFLAVQLSDGEISFDARRIDARTVTAVGVAPWVQMSKFPTKPGAALFLIAEGQRLVTPLCYSDQAEATAMGQYLAEFLSAEFIPQSFDVVVTTDFPGPSELWSRARRARLPLTGGKARSR